MIEVPEGLAVSQADDNGAAGRAFIDALPARAADFLQRWGLKLDGPSMYGRCALVLPVLRADSTPAALKLQLLDDESAGEAAALRAWSGAGAVRLLECEEETGTLLLERLDSARHLSQAGAVADSREAVRILAELLARLTARPAPEGLRRLGDIMARMLDGVDGAVASLADDRERRLLRDCAAAVREVADEPGDRLLHWDLHYDNVLAGEREPWLAIDPKPLAGDPGFELLPALWNRFDPAEVVWRFDLMTRVLGLDRERARAWTLGRVLQNSLWNVAREEALDPRLVTVGRTLLARHAGHRSS